MDLTLAEQIKCEIPLPDAPKENEGVIYCATNATNAAEIWSAVGACLGVIVTTFMAYFA